MEKESENDSLNKFFDEVELELFQSKIAKLPLKQKQFIKINSILEESKSKLITELKKLELKDLYAWATSSIYNIWLSSIMNNYYSQANKEYFEYHISGKEDIPEYGEILMNIIEKNFEKDFNSLSVLGIISLGRVRPPPAAVMVCNQ